jgi:CheY-like chemotaxis protein
MKEKNMDKYRILIVDDDKEVTKQVEEWLLEVQAECDRAHSEDEALERLKCKTYHLALLDIMLTSSQQDRGGIRLMQYISYLNEGTLYVALSRDKDHRKVIEALRLHVTDWLDKHTLRRPSDLVNPIQMALKTCKLRKLGGFRTLTSYLAFPEKVVSYWEGKAIETLGVSFDLFNDVLWRLVEFTLPALRINDGSPAFSFDKEQKSLDGLFWSKGLGKPIWLVLQNQAKELFEPHGLQLGNIVQKIQKKMLKGEVYEILGAPRDRFYERVDDMQKETI